jgi:hypothetical protein
MGVSTEYIESGVKVSSREGIDVTETALVEKGEPIVLSQTDESSISESSGGLSNMSIGLRLSDMLRLKSCSNSCDCSMSESTVISFSEGVRRFRCDLDLGGGMLVTARSAATDAGMASGE